MFRFYLFAFICQIDLESRFPSLVSCVAFLFIFVSYKIANLVNKMKLFTCFTKTSGEYPSRKHKNPREVKNSMTSRVWKWTFYARQYSLRKVLPLQNHNATQNLQKSLSCKTFHQAFTSSFSPLFRKVPSDQLELVIISPQWIRGSIVRRTFGP